jgi:ectoine hydroxylase-related dioxygenase (phytanoyl-CoA dioxygenase family)
MTSTHPRILDELSSSYSLTSEQIAAYQREGFIKLKNVLSAETLGYYRVEIARQVRERNTLTKPMAERNTYEKAFLQIQNLWEESALAREFVFAKRLARIAAELMRVSGVRMYHDQALFKEANGGFTPWHADQFYWPLSNDNSITAWIPLIPIPLEMGPLAFSIGSHRYNVGRDLEISDESEQRVSKALLEKQLPMEESAFDLGDVSFHSGWTFHRAGPNKSGKTREVMTIIYIEDGIRLAAPNSKAQQRDWEVWMPGVEIGGLVASSRNPVMYRVE